MRLRLDVRDEGDACRLCLKPHDTDAQGHATLKCFNSLRDTLHAILGDARIAASLEPHVFANPEAERKRADLYFPLSGSVYVADVAITHPFRDGYRLAAEAEAGGAATKQSR